MADLYEHARAPEVEDAVLATVTGIGHAKAAPVFLEHCATPLYFHQRENLLIAMAVLTLITSGKPCDQLTLMTHCKAVRYSDAMAAMRTTMRLPPQEGVDFGESLLRNLGERSVFTFTNVASIPVSGLKANLDILRKYHIQREVIRVLDDARRRAMQVDGAEKAREVGDETINAVASLLGTGTATADLGTGALAALIEHDRVAAGGEERIASWGVPALDRAVRLAPGTLTVLSASPGCGKTSLALQALMATVEHLGQGSADMASLEMGAAELGAILIAREVGSDRRSVERGWLTPEQRLIAGSAVERWRAMDIGMRSTAQRGNINDVCAWVRQRHMRSGGKLGLVIIDYLQLIPAANPRHSEYERISQATGELKQLTLSLNLAILLLSQQNREDRRANRDRDTGEVTNFPEPRLEGLRGSGSIEQDADAVMFLWKKQDFQTPIYPVEAIVAKNRRGAKARVALEFRGGDGQRFVEPETPRPRPAGTTDRRTMASEPSPSEDAFALF